MKLFRFVALTVTGCVMSLGISHATPTVEKEAADAPRATSAREPSPQPAPDLKSKYTRAQLVETYCARFGKDAPEEKVAQFYAKQAIEFAQSGEDTNQLKDIILQALTFDHDDAVTAQLYIYLGDAHQRQITKHEPDLWVKQRKLAAKSYLEALSIAVQNDLPAVAPTWRNRAVRREEPVLAIVGKGKKEREVLVRELIYLRYIATSQIMQLYGRPPENYEELRALAMQYLKSEKAAEQLVEAATKCRADVGLARIPIITRDAAPEKPKR